MKKAVILALMLMMSASAVYAASLGNVDIVGSRLSNIQIFSSDAGLGDVEKHLDVVGSKLDNIKIFSDSADLGNTEIVGGSVTNVTFSPPPKQRKPCDKTECYWDASCRDNKKDSKCDSCLKPHLGVDAWYGKYWYMDDIYTPKWPRVF
jgi:hypothetical protein